MLFRQMLWIPRKVPVCVFDRSPKGIFQSNNRLIFLGRLLVSPILLMGATGYYAYLAGQGRLRSIVHSELRHIMSSACLDNTYHVLDWFTRKGRLIVYVAEKTPTTGKILGPRSRKARAWIRRVCARLR